MIGIYTYNMFHIIINNMNLNEFIDSITDRNIKWGLGKAIIFKGSTGM
jgi:hypothetical protein